MSQPARHIRALYLAKIGVNIDLPPNDDDEPDPEAAQPMQILSSPERDATPLEAALLDSALTCPSEGETSSGASMPLLSPLPSEGAAGAAEHLQRQSDSLQRPAQARHHRAADIEVGDISDEGRGEYASLQGVESVQGTTGMSLSS